MAKKSKPRNNRQGNKQFSSEARKEFVRQQLLKNGNFHSSKVRGSADKN